MQQLANNMVLELSATKAKASSKGDGDDSMEKIDKVSCGEALAEWTVPRPHEGVGDARMEEMSKVRDRASTHKMRSVKIAHPGPAPNTPFCSW